MNKAHKGIIPVVGVVFALALTVWGTGCAGGDDAAEVGDPGDQTDQDDTTPGNDGSTTGDTGSSDGANNPPDGTGDEDGNGENDPPDYDEVLDLVAGAGIFLGLNPAYDFSVLLPFYVAPDGSQSSFYTTEQMTFTLSEESQSKLTGTLAEHFGLPSFLISPYLKVPKTLVKITGTEAGSLDVQARLTLLDDTPITAPTIDSRVTVIEYTPEELAQGQSYYDANGCAGCHAGGDTGAPAHTLGLVAIVSDQGLVDLLEDGAPFIPGTEVTFKHQYSFDSESEKRGIAGTLRRLQEKDLDLLVTTVVDSGDLSIFGL